MHPLVNLYVLWKDCFNGLHNYARTYFWSKNVAKDSSDEHGYEDHEENDEEYKYHAFDFTVSSKGSQEGDYGHNHSSGY